jgi:hypothetical protein
MGVSEAITKDREHGGASDVVCLGLLGMILRPAQDKLAMGFHVDVRMQSEVCEHANTSCVRRAIMGCGRINAIRHLPV